MKHTHTHKRKQIHLQDPDICCFIFFKNANTWWRAEWVGDAEMMESRCEHDYSNHPFGRDHTVGEDSGFFPNPECFLSVEGKT